MYKIEKRIMGIVREHLDKKNLKTLKTTELLSYDSLDLMNFFYRVEKEFCVRFTWEQLQKMDSISAIIEVINEIKDKAAPSKAV